MGTSIRIQYLQDLVFIEKLRVFASIFLDFQPYFFISFIDSKIDLSKSPRSYLLPHYCILSVAFHQYNHITNLVRIQYNKMQQQNLPASFKIPVDRLQAQFQCQICCNPITDCYVTRCGHVYCKGCIEQTVGRHHRCPFCTQQLKDFKADVFKNYHFNTLKKIVDEQRKKQTEKYLNKVFETDIKSRMQEENERIQALMKPIQQKIVEQCQQALLQYRKFMIKLYEVQKQAEQKKILLGAKGVRDHDTVIKDIQRLIQQSMISPVISPDIIEKPTQLEIVMPGNRVNKNIIKISPLSTFQSLLPFIEKICSQSNISLKGKIDQSFVINGRPVMPTDRFGMLAGKNIKIEKGIPFVEKVYCYTYNWEKGKISPFYICTTCQIKWICECCSLYCHAGHQTKLQLKQHKSQKAICYCVTKCDCKALNKNSME